jgi:hypothetical protein
MRILLIFILLVFSSANLSARDLSFDIVPSTSGFDVICQNTAKEDVIIPELRDGGFFHFFVVSLGGASVSKQLTSSRSQGFIISKRAIIVQAKTTEICYFENKWVPALKKHSLLLLFGMFSKIKLGKRVFDFFGPFLVTLDKNSNQPVFSIFKDEVSNDVRANFYQEFQSFQKYQNPKSGP